MPNRRLTVAALCLAATLMLVAAGAAPAATPLRPVDTRARDSGPVAAAARRAREQLEQRLGDEGVVTTDRVSGAARLVARTDGFLTGAGAGDPAAVALDYVRTQGTVFGLDGSDLGGLRLTSRYRSPDGVTHLAYVQTDRGIAAYDNVLNASVDRDGRLLNVGGSAVGGLAVGSAAPAIGAAAALAAAKWEVGGPLLAPRAVEQPGAERATRFANGDRARLTIFSDGRSDRLAWRVEATGTHGFLYEVVVDAGSGDVLKRRSLTQLASNALVYRNHPGAPAGGTPTTVDLNADPMWLNRSNSFTILRGNNAHAYADTGAPNGVNGSENIAPSSGTDWIYAQAPFVVPGQSCPLSGCSWNSTVPASKATNRAQATTQLFYLVNTFHDHLEAAPIGFTPAARNFEFSADPGGGVAGDPVLAEADDYAEIDNANMTTPADGQSPRLQADLFMNPSLNAADEADVIFHEYTHGLTNRSIGSGAGLDAGANQSQAMSEGWSDWYALDYLVAAGLVSDGAGVNGELTIGAYVAPPDGFRRQGIDCPVGSSAPACPGTSGAGPGGFTLGDMSHVGITFEVHDDGEIWAETLWDLRRALGSNTAQALITGGLRLSPDNPSFIEARDAIIQADQALGGSNYATLWQLFAARGMGYSATTMSSAATTADEAFDLPPLLLHDSSTVTDPPPGGDGDDVAEPGETVRLGEALHNANPFAIGAVSGQLTSPTPGVVAVQPAATWPAVATGSTAAGSPAFEVAIPSSASCDGDVALDLALSTDHGAFSLPLALALGRKPSADVPKTIASSTAVVSTLTFAGAGPVQDLEVHIPKLTHTWVGDLVVTLESPGGSTVTLMNSPGAGADGAPGDDFTDLVLADDAPTTIESIPATAPAGGYTGRYKPDQPLASLDGENRQGTWTLRVVDRYPASDSGTLRSWALRPSGCATPSNGAPVAAGDAYGVVAGTTLDGSSVLANDSDPDGAALTAVRRSGPSHGTLGLAAGGTFSYTPQPGFSGQDAFTYVAYDGTATSLPATVAITVTAASAQPSPSPPPPPPPPATVAPRAPAKLEVLRAGIRAGRLDVLAGITTRARGAVEVRYRSSGETTRFSTPIVDGRISIARSLPAAQRRKSTGIFTLTYDGSTTVQPDSVTLRAAPGKARLVLRAARIDGRGRLLASGSIDRRARGVVHVRLGYTAAGGSVELLSFSSKIARGAWSLTAPLPRAAAQAGGQLSIQFTGYEPLRIRGEQLAKAVEPAG